MTEIPTVQILSPPKPGTLEKEVGIQSLKDKMIRKVIDFKEKNCKKNRWVKEKNISKEEADGIKEIKEKTR